MANRNLAVRLVIGAVDKASKTFARVTGKVAALGTAIATYFSGRAIADFFSSAVSGAADFEQQMDAVGAVTRATGEEMEAFEAKALAAGESTKFTALEAAQAMEELARAGQEPQEVIASLDSVLALAQANAIGLAESAQITAQALAGFNLEASESGRVADVLTLAAQSANTTVTQLGEGLSYAAPIANAFGYSIEQTTTFLAKMADAGVDASRGGTALTSMLTQLADPASKASKALDAAGIATRDLTEVIAELAKGGPDAEAAILAFGTEAGPGLRSLIGAGSDAIREFIGNLEDAENASGKAARTMSDNLTGAFTSLGSAWDTLKTRLATPLLEPLANEIKDITARIREFAQGDGLPQLSASIVKAFKDMSAAAKGFFSDLDFSALTKSISDFVSSAGEHLGKFAVAMSKVKNVTTTALDAMTAAWLAVQQAVELVAGVISKIIGGLAGGYATLVEGLESVGLASETAALKARDAADTITQAGADMLDLSKRHYGEMVEIIKGLGESHEAVVVSVERHAEAERDLIEEMRNTNLTLQEFEAQSELAAAAATAFATSTEKSTEATKKLSSAVDESGQKIDFSRIKIGEHGEALFDHTSVVGESKKAIEEQSDAVEKSAQKIDKTKAKIGEHGEVLLDHTSIVGGNTDAVEKNTDAVTENADVLGDVKTKIDEVKASAAEMGEAIAKSAETASASLTTLFDTLDAISERTESVRNGFDGLGESATGAFSLIDDSGESGGGGSSGSGSGGGGSVESVIDIQSLAEQLAADSRNLGGIKDYLFSWIQTVGAFNAGGLDWVGDQLNQIRSLANEIREEQDIGRSQLPTFLTLQVNLDGEEIARNTMQYSDIIGGRSS